MMNGPRYHVKELESSLGKPKRPLNDINVSEFIVSILEAGRLY